MKKSMKGLFMASVLACTTFLSGQLQYPVLGAVQPVEAAKNYSAVNTTLGTYPAWNSTAIYNSGNIVSYGGKLWTAQWWTQGQIPGTTGEWGVWKLYKTIEEPAGKKLIALTFDDGPSPTTSEVLDKLQKYNVVASFFLVGQNVTNTFKPTLQRELSLGCEIGNHSWTHSSMDKMGSNTIKDEIQKTSDTIYNMVGVRPKFFRPPYIATSNSMYEAIDLPFICGVGCTDWDASVTAHQRAETLLTNAKDGDILLLHDLNGNTLTVNALDEIIPGLKDKGFTFVTVSQLFEQKGINPNVEYKLWTNTAN